MDWLLAHAQHALATHGAMGPFHAKKDHPSALRATTQRSTVSSVRQAMDHTAQVVSASIAQKEVTVWEMSASQTSLLITALNTGPHRTDARDVMGI